MGRPLVQEIEEEKKKKKIEKSCNVRNGPRKEREKRPTNEGPAYGVWLHMSRRRHQPQLSSQFEVNFDLNTKIVQKMGKFFVL